MKKLTIIFLSALLPMSLAFAEQKPIPADELDYAFAGEVLTAEPLSESEMEAVEGEHALDCILDFLRDLLDPRLF